MAQLAPNYDVGSKLFAARVSNPRIVTSRVTRVTFVTFVTYVTYVTHVTSHVTHVDFSLGLGVAVSLVLFS